LTDTGAGRTGRTPAKKAVILAAGSGTRLRVGGRASPKPLVEVLGVSLLERQLQCLTRLIHLDEVIVVLGCEADAVRERIEHSGPWPFIVRAVDNADWACGNGTSLYSAKDWVEGEGEGFFVLMADHMFEPETLERFAAKAGGEPALSVSNGSDPKIDLDEATKVSVDEQGRIREISKTLSEFTAVEMGLFYLDDQIFPALERAFREGEHTLTSGVQRLIAETPLLAVLSSDAWFDIDTIDDLRHAERHLLRKIQSPSDA
jgi:choline kinase